MFMFTLLHVLTGVYDNSISRYEDQATKKKKKKKKLEI